MESEDIVALNREYTELICIKKEEFLDDYSLTDTLEVKEEVASICDDEQGTLEVKEEVASICDDEQGTLEVKEEVASICDDEQGYIISSNYNHEEIKVEPGVYTVCDSGVASQEDKKISLNSEDEGTVLDHLVENTSHPSDLKIKRKGRKQRKLKVDKVSKTTGKTKGRISKTGRLSRDEIFKDKKYFCYLCKKFYIGRKSFKKHFEIHFTICQERFICQICNYNSGNVSHMNRHLLEVHFLGDEKEKMFGCTLCERSFHGRKDLERHMYVHTGEGHLKCAECSFSCTSKARLETHLSSIHRYPRNQKYFPKKDIDSEFICYYCNYTFTDKSCLRFHIKRHMGFKAYKCAECSYECMDQSSLQKHYTTHSDARPFICNECNRSFKRRSHLLIHFNNGAYRCVKQKRKSKRV